jgi:signal transduction histidine kinase
MRPLAGSYVDTGLSELNEEQFGANRFALVSRLADDLAHEIKNPLNAIIINLEVLKVRLGKGDADSALERAEVIEHEVRRLHHLMDRLLQLIRPEREEAGSLALDSAMDELLPLIDAQTRLARNRLRVDCSAAVIVHMRRDVFKFAMLNLLTAVHEALGEGGGVLAVGCSVDESSVSLLIAAERAPESAVRPVGPDYEQALETAAALLGSCGGRIERGPGSVTVTLPRAAAS